MCNDTFSTLSIFILISLMGSSLAQTHVPFVVDSVAWKEYQSVQLDLGSYYNTSYYNYIIGDTLIDSLNYKNVYQTRNLFNTNFSPIAFIREENKKVYVLYPDVSSLEFLLYDFSLNVGDSMIFPDFIHGGNLTFRTAYLNSIDSIQLENGSYRKRFKFSNWSEIIEGIGNAGINVPNTGLFQTIGGLYLDYTHTLGCYMNPSEALYKSFQYQYYDTLDCYSFAVGIRSTHEDSKIAVYPNPIRNTLHFTSRMNNCDAKIYALTGELILTIPNFESDQIDLSILVSGLYYGQLKYKDEMKIFKFIKE